MTERIARKKFAKRVCAADGCNERFKPVKEDHIYHDEKCASYMRVKKWREDKKAEAAASAK